MSEFKEFFYPADCEVRMRINPENLVSIAEKGFLTQFETQTTSPGGKYAPGARAQVEEMFGAKHHLRYGYSADADDEAALNEELNDYGEIAVAFKPEIREYTTFSEDDSLSIFQELKITKVQPFVEAQIDKELTLADVAYVVLPATQQPFAVSEEAAKVLDGLDVRGKYTSTEREQNKLVKAAEEEFSKEYLGAKLKVRAGLGTVTKKHYMNDVLARLEKVDNKSLDSDGIHQRRVQAARERQLDR